MSPSIDGFVPSQAEAFRGMSPEGARRFYRHVSAAARRLHVEVEGVDYVPTRGRALIVANHTFGFDIVFPMAEIFRVVERFTWSLGEHAWWKIPFVRRLAVSIGVVDGTPENADRLLQSDELVLVLPGGLREAVKPRELRYRLLWGHRYGFVRAAIRNRAPIIPLAAIGGDELVDLVGNPFERGRRWLGMDRLPLLKPSRLILHRIKLRYVFGEPILLEAKPEDVDDPARLRRCRLEVEGALHELIDRELARKAGMEWE